MKHLRAACASIAVLAMVACIKDFVSDPVPPSGQRRGTVVVQPAALVLEGAGTSSQLGAEPLDENGFVLAGRTIRWTSLNPSVATVDSLTGLVTARSAGQAIVSATADQLVGYALVTVSSSGLPSLQSLTTLAAGPTGSVVSGVWGTSDTVAFAVGSAGLVLRFDGTRWQTAGVPVTGANLAAVWGASAQDVYAVGNEGIVLHFDGAAWVAVPDVGTTETLLDVWGASPRDVYVVGASGTMRHWNGRLWETVNLPVTGTLRAIWGSSATAVFAVGDGGTVLHFDGRAWTVEPTTSSAILTDVWGSGPAQMLAVGANGTILRRTGAGWLAEPSGTAASLAAVWGTSATEAYAVGAQGTVVRRTGLAWATAASGTTQDLRGVWGTSTGGLHLVGAGGTALSAGASGARLVFARAPVSVEAGADFQAEVRLADARGLVRASGDTVWLLVQNAAGASAGPEVPVTLDSGVAVGQLRVTTSGDGYVLTARTGGVAAARSPAFSVVAGPLQQMLFTASPGTAVVDSALGAVAVALVDQFGNVVRTAGQGVSILLQELPVALQGINQRAAVAGLATFTDLRVRTAGRYTLRASASGLPAVVSDTFAVVSPGTPASIDVVSLRVPLGSTFTPTATVLAADGSTLPGVPVTWESLSPSVVSALPSFQAVATGQATVAARAGNVVGYGVITVNEPSPPTVDPTQGAQWVTLASPTSRALRALWLDGDRLTVVGDGGTAFEASGTGPWTSVTMGADEDLNGVWKLNDGLGYAAGSLGGVFRLGAAGSRVRVPVGLRTIWGAGPEHVLIGGTVLLPAGIPTPIVWRFGATGLSSQYVQVNFFGATRTIASLWGWSGTDHAFVESSGDLNFGGSFIPCAGRTVSAIWGPSPGEAFIVGEGGLVVRWNGTSCTPMASGVQVALHAVHGTGPSDVYAVGDAGTILYYDGVSWRRVSPAPTTASLYAVKAQRDVSGRLVVVAAGTNGTVVRLAQ